MESSEIVYIYALSHPETGETRYIGKTNNPKRRYSQHTEKRMSKRLSCWIDYLESQDLKPKMTIIEETTLEEWSDREVYWIRFFKNLGADLLNWGNGGGENFGYKHSEESKEKMREAAKNRPPNRKGQKNSEEHRANISRAKKGKSVPHLLNRESIEKVADSKRGRPRSEETKRKISESLKNRGLVRLEKS